MPEKCPHCGVDLNGDPIPQYYREYYGNTTHYSRVIGIVVHDRLDRWRCPDCNGEWSREFPVPIGVRTCQIEVIDDSPKA